MEGGSCTSESGPPRASRTTSCVNRCREHGMTRSPSCPDIQVSTRRSRVPDARSWNACRLASDALQTTYTDDGVNEQMSVRPTSSQPTGPPHAPHARPLDLNSILTSMHLADRSCSSCDSGRYCSCPYV